MSNLSKSVLVAALESLPVFPLPNVLLFPGQTLPLHVFEPRYLTMVDDLLRGSRLLGVPLLHDGESLVELPNEPFYEVFGVGEIVGHRQVFGDQLAVLVRGVARVRMIEELASEKPYRLVRCGLIERCVDEGSVGDEMVVINSLLSQLAGAKPQVAMLLEQIEANAPDLPGLIDLLAAYVIGGSSQRQQLMEAEDLGLRVTLMAQMLADIVLKSSADDQLH